MELYSQLIITLKEVHFYCVRFFMRTFSPFDPQHSIITDTKKKDLMYCN